MPQPEQFIETYAATVRSLDSAAMQHLYAPEARVFDAMPPTEYPDRDAWAGMIQDWFGSLREGDAVVEDVRLLSSDSLAVITGHVTYDGTMTDGDPADVTCRVTWVLQKQDDDWKIVHEHTSVPMEDDETDEEDEADAGSSPSTARDDDYGDSDDDHDDDDNAIEDETGLGEQDDRDVES